MGIKKSLNRVGEYDEIRRLKSIITDKLADVICASILTGFFPPSSVDTDQ